jgi:glycosyltransferase involved in cell wall biosynthesis
VSKISIIAPAYNEGKRIRKFLEKTVSVMNSLGFDYEVVLVDDGSVDNTREEALSAAQDPHVKVVGYDNNIGKGFALKYGFAYTTGDIIAFIDSDLEISPQQIAKYVSATEKGSIVAASKWHPESHVEMPIVRKFLSCGFNLAVKLLTGLRVSDTQSGLKAFRREALEKILPRLSMKRYAFDVEFLTVANLYGFKIMEYPISIKMMDRPRFKPLFNMVCAMLVEILGITYRLRILKWYNRH